MSPVAAMFVVEAPSRNQVTTSPAHVEPKALVGVGAPLSQDRIRAQENERHNRG